MWRVKVTYDVELIQLHFLYVMIQLVMLSVTRLEAWRLVSSLVTAPPNCANEGKGYSTAYIR